MLNAGQPKRSHYHLGINAGEGSTSYAIVKDDANGKPVGSPRVHVLTYSRGVDPSTNATNNSKRRGYRHGYRGANRTKRRKKLVRKLFVDAHLLTDADEVRALQTGDVYFLRYYGLTHRLTHGQLFKIVYFFAHSRGFKEQKVHTSAAGTLLKALRDTYDELQKHHDKYPTIGAMLYKSKLFRGPNGKLFTRNRHGQMRIAISRKEVVSELKMLLRIQRAYDPRITKRFSKACVKLISEQRSFDVGTGKGKYAGGVKNRVGRDTFDHRTLVAPKASASFEYYRMLDKLNNLRYLHGGKWMPLTQQQRDAICQLRYKRQSITYRQLEKVTRLPKGTKFNLADGATFATFKATRKIGKAIGDVHNTKLIDLVGGTLTWHKDKASAEKHLKSLRLTAPVIKNLLKLADKQRFSGEASISVKSIRKMLPYMQKGYNSHNAAVKAGLTTDHPRKRPLKLDDIKYFQCTFTNPAQIRAIHINFRALNAITNKLGAPDYIAVNSGRDISHTAHSRKYIEDRQDRSRKRKDKIDAYLKRRHHEVNAMNRLDLFLYKRQHGRDIYPPFERLTMHRIFDGQGYAEIDHAQPVGITWNNSRNNLVLTTKAHNHAKGERTPRQWLVRGSRADQAFVARVNKIFPAWQKARKKDGGIKYHKSGKKKGTPMYVPDNVGVRRDLLKIVPKRAINTWGPRDTANNRNIGKFLYNFLRLHMHYAKGAKLGRQRTFITNGRVTSLLRHAWRIPVDYDLDEVHGVMALLIAMSTPALKQRVSRFYKRWARWYGKGHRPHFPLPYQGFLKDARHLRISIRRLPMHNDDMPLIKDSKYSARYLKAGLVMKHQPVTGLKATKNKKTGEYALTYNNGAWKYHRTCATAYIYNALLKALLRHHNNGAKAFPDDYLSLSGHRIYKVKVFKRSHGGIVSHRYGCVNPHGGIARVDIYRRNGKYVAVLAHPIDIRKHRTPTLIMKGRGKRIDSSYDYQFSLRMFDPVSFKLKKPKKFTFGDRKPYESKTFTGLFRRISGNSLLVQPFDMSSRGDRQHYASVSIGQLVKLEKLQPTDLFGDGYNEI